MAERANATRRLTLMREEGARWDELTRFVDSHQGSLRVQDELELRRLRAAWTAAAQALFNFDNPG